MNFHVDHSLPEASPETTAETPITPEPTPFITYNPTAKSLAKVSDPLTLHRLFESMKDDAYSFAEQQPTESSSGSMETYREFSEPEHIAYWGITNVLIGNRDKTPMKGHCHVQKNPYMFSDTMRDMRHLGLSLELGMLSYAHSAAEEARALVITEGGHLGIKTSHAGHTPRLGNRIRSYAAKEEIFAPEVIEGKKSALKLAQKQWRDMIIQKGFDPSFVPKISRQDAEKAQKLAAEKAHQELRAELAAEEARIQASPWLRFKRWVIGY